MNTLYEWAEENGVQDLPAVFGASMAFAFAPDDPFNDQPLNLLEIDYDEEEKPVRLRVADRYQAKPDNSPDCHDLGGILTLGMLRTWMEQFGCADVELVFGPSKTSIDFEMEAESEFGSTCEVFDAPVNAVEIDLEDGNPVRTRVVEYDS